MENAAISDPSVSAASITFRPKTECNCSCRQTQVKGSPCPSEVDIRTKTQPPQALLCEFMDQDVKNIGTEANQATYLVTSETVQAEEDQIYDDVLSQGDLQELPSLSCSPLTQSNTSSPASPGVNREEIFFSMAYPQSSMIMSPSFDFTVPYLGEEYFHEATSIDESGISNWLSFEALTENLDMPMVLSPGHEPGGICMQPNYPDRQGLEIDTLQHKKRRLSSEPPSSSSYLKQSNVQVARRNSEGDSDAKARVLACPFYKRHPREHQECSKYVLKRLKDVKQHLKRHHGPPEFYCARCYAVFAGAAARDGHARGAACRVRAEGAGPGPGGVVPAATMRRLLRYGARGKPAEAQWFDLWDALFAGVPRPRSAYVGSRGAEAVALLRALWDGRQDDLLARAGGGGGGGAAAVRSVMEEMLDRLEAEA